jgi:dihydrofolate reductase
MKAILAVNNLGFIGLNDALPWRNLEDFKHFKKLTMGGTLLVGYNTFQTLPPLKGRHVVVDTRKEEFDYLRAKDAEYLKQFMSNELKMPLWAHGSGEVWCIGGKKTYEKYAHMFTELHISHIDDNTIGDTMFPDLSKLNRDCVVYNYHF